MAASEAEDEVAEDSVSLSGSEDYQDVKAGSVLVVNSSCSISPGTLTWRPTLVPLQGQLHAKDIPTVPPAVRA